MMIVSVRTLKAMTAYSAGKMKRTQITQNIVDLCLSQMQFEKLVITVLNLLIDNQVYLDRKYICNIALLVIQIKDIIIVHGDFKIRTVEERLEELKEI